mgnify:CR=1 FL=1|jgi:hypothetical protein
MPREVVFFDIYMPNLTQLFLLTLLVGWGIDRVAAWCGLYQHAWHPTMLRVSLFVCLYGAVALYIYR